MGTRQWQQIIGVSSGEGTSPGDFRCGTGWGSPHSGADSLQAPATSSLPWGHLPPKAGLGSALLPGALGVHPSWDAPLLGKNRPWTCSFPEAPSDSFWCSAPAEVTNCLFKIRLQLLPALCLPDSVHWGEQLCFAMKKATQSGLETCSDRHDSGLVAGPPHHPALRQAPVAVRAAPGSPGAATGLLAFRHRMENGCRLFQAAKF